MLEQRPDFDLTNPECYVTGDPHPLLKWLRHNAPLSRISDREGNQYWALTKYADQVKVYRDPLTLSSQGPIAMTMPSGGIGETMIVTDPPRHRRGADPRHPEHTPVRSASLVEQRGFELPVLFVVPGAYERLEVSAMAAALRPTR